MVDVLGPAHSFISFKMKDIGEKEDLLCLTDSDDMDQDKTEHRSG